MGTFEEIVFPPLPKKPIDVTKPFITNMLGFLEFWFKEVIDHVEGTDTVLVMVRCPECGEVFPLMNISPERVEVVRDCILKNSLYYLRYVKLRCSNCKGVLS